MPPSYDQLKNDAVSAYLGSGGSQSNVDSYFAQNPGQDYNQLARDASAWYTNPNQEPMYTQDKDPAWYTAAHQGWQTGVNNDVADYFGIQAPPAGQNYNFAAPAPSLGGAPTSPAPSAPPSQNGGMGSFTPPITPATSPGSGMGYGSAPVTPTGPIPNTFGDRGTLSNAMADPGDYWRAHRNDAYLAGANQGEYSPGSNVPGKDPWLQSQTGYTWLGGKPPGGVVMDTKGNPVLSGGSTDLSGLPEAGWLQSQFGVKPPDWKNAQDVIRYRRQLQYYWPDIIQRDPTLAKYGAAGKLKNPAFLDSEESGTY